MTGMARSTDNNHARSSVAFVSSIKSSAKRLTSSISPVKEGVKDTRVYSLTDTEYQPSFSNDRSSTSSRSSNRTAFRRKAASASTASLPYLQEKHLGPVSPPKYNPSPPISVPKRKPVPTPQSFAEVPLTRAVTASAALAHAGAKQNMAGSGTMTMAPFAPAFRSGSDPSSKPPSTAHSNASFQMSNTVPVPAPSLPAPPGAYNPMTVFQHIHDMSSKRISTLDYLRKR